MKRGKPKRFFNESGKSTDELKDCDMLERDPDRFLCVEAEAAAVVLSRREEKLKLKKQKVKDQTGQTEGTPVNIENLKRKWGKWYFFGMNESGQYRAKCRACSSWYVGINKKQRLDGTPFKGYEYCTANVIKHGKQKLGWDGHLKEHGDKENSNRAHWRAVRGLRAQQKLLKHPAQSQQVQESLPDPLSSKISRDNSSKTLLTIGLKPSIRKVEREKRGLEVLARIAYITAKADMPISKFGILRNCIQQSQLTLLADAHLRIETICSRLNDFFTVVEIQIRGLKSLVDINLTLIDPKLKGFRRVTTGNLTRGVMHNAIRDLGKSIKRQFDIIREDIVGAVTELLRDASHTSQRLAAQGTNYGYTYHAYKRVFDAIRKQTLREMHDARGWTFMLDESTDLTVTKQLLVTVKYYHVDTKTTRTRILDLTAIPNGQAETMLKAVSNLFKECALDLNYCYGVGADGASANQGKHGGFITLFLKKLALMQSENVEFEEGLAEEKENINNKCWIPGVWCFSHLTALGSSAGNENCMIAMQFEDDMKDINADFTSSAPRIAALENYQQMLSATEAKFLRITPWHKCRWLSRDSSTRALVRSLKALLNFYNNRAFGRNNRGLYLETDSVLRAKMVGRYHKLTRYQLLR